MAVRNPIGNLTATSFIFENLLNFNAYDLSTQSVTQNDGPIYDRLIEFHKLGDFLIDYHQIRLIL